MCILTTCVPGTLGCQKWALVLLVQELQMVVGCQLVLQTEPGSSGEQPELLTAEPSLLPRSVCFCPGSRLNSNCST